MNLTLGILPTSQSCFHASAFFSLDAEVAALEGKLSTAHGVKAGMMSALLGVWVRLV
jgi:hypothetical protein